MLWRTTTFSEAIDRAEGPTSFTVWRPRGADSMKVVIGPEMVCPYSASLAEGGVNAYVAGTNVIVTRGMLNFIESNEELQFVLAHELAHDRAGHLDAIRNNSIACTLIGAVADAAIGTPGTFSTAGR